MKAVFAGAAAGILDAESKFPDSTAQVTFPARGVGD